MSDMIHSCLSITAFFCIQETSTFISYYKNAKMKIAMFLLLNTIVKSVNNNPGTDNLISLLDWD